MIDLLNVYCSSVELALFLNVVKNVMRLIQIVAPIVLIVSLTMHFIKIMTNPDDKKLPSKIKNSVIATLVLFFIPVIVDVVMGMLGEGYNISSCWNSVSGVGGNSTYIDIDGNRKSIFSGEYEKGNANTGGDVGGSSSTGGNSSSSGEVLPTTGSGTYFPALQGSGFRISKPSETGGCANTSGVYHDLSISQGHKIYAAFDGEIKYKNINNN